MLAMQVTMTKKQHLLMAHFMNSLDVATDRLLHIDVLRAGLPE